MWSWIRDILSNRTARCHIDGVDGELFNTNVGLPQGSIIAPILFYFNVYIKDRTCSGPQLAATASLLMMTHWSTGSDVKDMQTQICDDMEEIHECNMWQMKLSLPKTIFTICTPTPTERD